MFKDLELVDFGEAIKLLKNGKKVSRKGWNGVGMYAYYVPANSYPASTEIAKKEFLVHHLIDKKETRKIYESSHS